MNILDLRQKLPLNSRWDGATIGTRGQTRFVTLHYNGPAVPEHRQSGLGLMQQLRIDLDWQTQPGWSGVPQGADGLQYHFVVAADGTVYQTRDEDALLWHCANGTGNAQSLSVHFPIGGLQEPTDAMWQAGVALVEHLRHKYSIARGAVLGHLEWSSNTCPGRLMPRIVEYRNAEPVPPKEQPEPGRYICIWPATVRTDYTVAGDYVLTLQRGHEVEVDAWKESKDTSGRGVGWWAHWETGLGFVHESALERMED
jgi:hypothetical protein